LSILTLDRQQASDTCEHCARPIPVVRGSIYDDGRPFGLYLIGMHRCSTDAVAIMAVALSLEDGGPPRVIHIRVDSGPDALEMRFIDPEISPWRTHRYLGAMLSAVEARVSPLRDRFLQVADRIVEDVPDVQTFLNAS
jgi:hypothetical protein